MSLFSPATKYDLKLRMGLVGASGSGKTYTALQLASYLGQKVAVIDSEHGSARKYADQFNFDVCELDDFSPLKYIEAIEEASSFCDVLIIDSLSHAWNGKGGALEMVDDAILRDRGGNRFTAWRDVTPIHNRLVESILSTPCHVLVTMRAKTEYVMEEYTDKGRTKTRPVKIGLAPIQRDGLEYEFDVVADMTHENSSVIGKTRCSALAQKVFRKPGQELADTLMKWLSGTGENPEVPYKQFLKDVGAARQQSGMSRQEVIQLAQSQCGISGSELRGIPEKSRQGFVDAIAAFEHSAVA